MPLPLLALWHTNSRQMYYGQSHTNEHAQILVVVGRPNAKSGIFDYVLIIVAIRYQLHLVMLNRITQRIQSNRVVKKELEFQRKF